MTDQTNAITTFEPKHSLGIIQVQTPHDVIVQASGIAKELAGIIRANKLSMNLQGREYVRVEGWSTMGAMLGVLPREVYANRLEDGGYEAMVELIRTSDGAVIGRASAIVGVDEKDRNGKPTWGNRPEYARRSMAVTRATGKAYRLGFSWIIGLAGFEPTPAEEMIDGEFHETTTQSGNGKPATQPPVEQPAEQHKQVSRNPVAELIAAGCENEYSAMTLINKYIPQAIVIKGVDAILEWYKLYKTWHKDAGMDTPAAAKNASEGLAFEK